MGTGKIRGKIRSYLKDQPRNTIEIQEHINTTTRHGTTTQQLGNVLSKDRYTFKLGKTRRSGLLSGAYEICEWGTSDWILQYQNPENPFEIVYESSRGSSITYFLSESDVDSIRNLREKDLEEVVD
ncbi:MAG: DUF3860 domain-containing protein [Candidatus Nanoarchaeia archaeon]|jgi:hypothetical protein|nr:DUF3860 domain-containing protein [Candidatus Nanoarchaeia archaeon]|tara:strand:+ start:3022 stop:3399 length:378 start_codon:yes stop_codon:yes gene_type:complete